MTDTQLLREIVHEKSRPVHGTNPPRHKIDSGRMEQIADRIASLPEYNSVEMLYELVQANLITFWEMYLLLGKAIRQPEMMKVRCDAAMTPAFSLKDKLESPKGLCTSVAKSHKENAERIRFIIDAFLNDVSLQMADRTEDNWTTVLDLPSDFDKRYRKQQ
jgi:hypothetical protein